MDRIDKITKQWQRERPDLDVSPMGLIGRLGNITLHLSREMEKIFSQFGLNTSSFDVLATLRRAGAPYTLSPGEMLSTLMVTSGTMTNRIDQLEKAGWVIRKVNPEDGRGFLVSLTPEGLELINQVIKAHVENQKRLVSGLSQQEQQALNQLLKVFLKTLE
ncbi:MarR family winged helix-turn-helix transcriptional regulator [Proteus terrae]|uniref:MarR family transcriptional regulator n=1 Tax=Proteus terrae subsp. cibarius TaxID=626774 RepID=A0ABX6JKW9_9GAMM|nr:MarR family transcriptional regulator [Proteus terrae]QHP76467.1 MarR family transcriptional regulator [Proteus vulgaris]MBG3092041.1 MarR family transcriptional regulator [Proteus terrae subsp. cibarius]QGW03171.1 MarR family transcriptional regulator [Proteus terrae subsp. cibarius]QHD95591.1 MarR family transcriptional regulator [Proteus terrae subsp. cibarius]QIF89817.1 MarR family transcriptional regulator [Proteus terrae subsp. cibarius]